MDRSELFLGKYYKEIDKKIVIATKFMPYPWRLSKSRIEVFIKAKAETAGFTPSGSLPNSLAFSAGAN